MRIYRFVIWAAVIMLAVCTVLVNPSHADDTQAAVEVVKVLDDRKVGAFSSESQIILRIPQTQVGSTSSMRYRLVKGTTDRGQNIAPRAAPEDFQTGRSWHVNDDELAVKIIQPARAATYIEELVGLVEFFDPERDTNARVRLSPLSEILDTPVQIPLGSGDPLVVTIRNKAQHEAFSAKMEKEQEESEDGSGMPIVDAMEEAFTEMFSGFAAMGSVSQSSLVVYIDGPVDRLRVMKLQGSDGEDHDVSSRHNTGGAIQVYNFQQAPPDDGVILLTVATDEALQVAEFHLKDIPLP